MDKNRHILEAFPPKSTRIQVVVRDANSTQYGKLCGDEHRFRGTTVCWTAILASSCLNLCLRTVNSNTAVETTCKAGITEGVMQGISIFLVILT